MPFPVYGWITISLGSGIQVLIRIRVQKKVGTCPAGGVGGVIVLGSVGVEKLAGVEGTVPAGLKPHWEIILIEAFVDELWVATYKKIRSVTVLGFSVRDVLRV